jgi:hypothetical protein
LPTLFLHIGSGKTGTSALQAAFARNAETLLRYGVVYPDSPSNMHAAEGMITSGNAVALATYLDPRLKFSVGKTDGLAALVSELRAADGRDVLYSSEFLGRFRPPRLRDLVERARTEGYTPKLVLYVRSIVGHAYSVYTQAVKRRQYTGDFTHFVEVYKNRFVETLDRAEGIVPTEGIIVRNFDTVRSDVFKDFLQNVLKLEVASGEIASVPIINRSLSFFEIEFVRRLNALVENRYQSVFTSDALISTMPDLRSRVVVSQQEVDILIARFTNVVHAINKYIDGGGIKVIDDSIEIGCRPTIEFTEFERCVISVLARLIPETRRDHVSDLGAEELKRKAQRSPQAAVSLQSRSSG